MRLAFFSLSLLSLLPTSALAAEPSRARERHQREWDSKARKMEQHLLRTMRKHGVDMWILLSRENHPDPVLDLFGAYGVSGWYGHRNAYVFYDAGGGGVNVAKVARVLGASAAAVYPAGGARGEQMSGLLDDDGYQVQRALVLQIEDTLGIVRDGPLERRVRVRRQRAAALLIDVLAEPRQDEVVEALQAREPAHRGRGLLEHVARRLRLRVCGSGKTHGDGGSDHSRRDRALHDSPGYEWSGAASVGRE